MGKGLKKSGTSLTEKLLEIADPLCQAENFELVHLECVSLNRDTVIRFFMDKPGGITLDDCAYLSRQLGDLIEVYLEDLGRYRLEVSSPGPNRPLKTKKDFERFSGSRIRIETTQLIEDKQKFTGILEIVNDDSVVIASDGKSIEIRFPDIRRAALAGR